MNPTSGASNDSSSSKHLEDLIKDCKEKVNRFSDAVATNKEKIEDLETKVLILIQHAENHDEEDPVPSSSTSN